VTRVDAEVLRHMRPTLSELGEYDGTALMEFKTRKEIVYLLERGTVCTYEMDDTPPFEIDDEAVEIALEIAMLCDLNLVSELHVMRKQYLDGSIPTGFQRTAMVGLTGVVPFRYRSWAAPRAAIRQLSLEEDSCREVSDVGHRITFRTDRLGTPLTEIVTEPDLLTPPSCRRARGCWRYRACVTGGCGAAPVRAGRTSTCPSPVAGASRSRACTTTAGCRCSSTTEAFRQLNLLRVRAELQRRGVTPELTSTLRAVGRPWETSHPRGGRDAPRAAGGIMRRCSRRWSVATFGLRREAARLQGDSRAPHAARASPSPVSWRSVSASSRAPSIRRSWPTPTTTMPRPAPAAGPGSGACSAPDSRATPSCWLWAPADDAETAAREVLIRAREALAGVPAETRQALPDGTTGFERILPGPDRMYPDTDTPPLPIADETVERIRARLPESPWLRQARYERLGLAASAASRLADSGWADLFDAVGPATGIPAQRLAEALEQRRPAPDSGAGAAAARHAHDPRARPHCAARPRTRAWRSASRALKRAVAVVLADAAADPADVSRDVFSRVRPMTHGWKPGSGTSSSGPVCSPADPARRVLRWAMGEAMSVTGLTADPAWVRDRLDTLLRATPVEAAR
jgi:glutamyl-tRNA(Gln) amidotransferase subunit E